MTRLDGWRKVLIRAKSSKIDGDNVIEWQGDNYHHYKVLDASILIDRRIYDSAKTGFLEGILPVSNFVLYGLQYIADSGEGIKHVRGRHGPDILNRLRKEKIVPIEMYDGDLEDTPEVDSKLIAPTKGVNGIIMTDDYNPNRVVQFQNVQVLNISNLAESL